MDVVKQTYRTILVYLANSIILRMRWEEIDNRTRPLELKSAPLIFLAVSRQDPMVDRPKRSGKGKALCG